MMLKELAAGGKALKGLIEGEPYDVFERDYSGVVGVFPALVAALKRLQAFLDARETDPGTDIEPYLASFCEAQWYGRFLLADPHTRPIGDMVRDTIVDLHEAIDPDTGFRKPIFGGLLAKDEGTIEGRLNLLIIQCETFSAATKTLLEHVRVRPRVFQLLLAEGAGGASGE